MTSRAVLAPGRLPVMYPGKFAGVFAGAALSVVVRGEPPAVVPVAGEDPLAPSALPAPGSRQWFTGTGEDLAPARRSQVTLRSAEMFTGYEPAGCLPPVSPTPPLVPVASGGHLVPSERAAAAFGHAREPKRLTVWPGGHFDACGAGSAAASGPARDWFVQHLAP